MQQSHKIQPVQILGSFVILIVILVVVFFAIDYITNRNEQKIIRRDLLEVSAKIEAFKSAVGSYPSSDELETVFSSDDRYLVPLKNHAKLYPDGLSFNNNFFYCKQDSPAKFIVMAVQDYDYALYVSNGNQIQEYDLRGVSPGDRPEDYPFHVHANASQDVCPKFLPGFADSADGKQVEPQWARWTGIE